MKILPLEVQQQKTFVLVTRVLPLDLKGLAVVTKWLNVIEASIKILT